MIYEHLKTGKKNALSTTYLMNCTGISSEREFRKQIAAERASGLLIMSSKSGGYYLPADREELLRYVRETEKAIRSLQLSLKSAKDKLHSLPMEGQLEMNLADSEADPDKAVPQDQAQAEPEPRPDPEEISKRIQNLRNRFSIN